MFLDAASEVEDYSCFIFGDMVPNLRGKSSWIHPSSRVNEIADRDCVSRGLDGAVVTFGVVIVVPVLVVTVLVAGKIVGACVASEADLEPEVLLFFMLTLSQYCLNSDSFVGDKSGSSIAGASAESSQGRITVDGSLSLRRRNQSLMMEKNLVEELRSESA